MPDATSLIVFMTATLALNLTPGPDMLYVIARSVGQGQRAGVVSALGIGGGCLAHTFATAFGLSALLMSSALAYNRRPALARAQRRGPGVVFIALGLRLAFTKRS